MHTTRRPKYFQDNDQESRKAWYNDKLREQVTGQNLHVFRGLPGSGHDLMPLDMLEKGEYIRRSGLTIDEFMKKRVIRVNHVYLDHLNRFLIPNPRQIIARYKEAHDAVFNIFDSDHGDTRKDACIIGIFSHIGELFKLFDTAHVFGINTIIWEPENEWAQDPDECYKRSDKKIPLEIMRDIRERFRTDLTQDSFCFAYAKHLQHCEKGVCLFGRNVRDRLDGPRTKSFSPDNKSIVVETKPEPLPVQKASVPKAVSEEDVAAKELAKGLTIGYVVEV